MLPFGLFQLPNFSPSVIFGTIMNLTFYGMIFVLSLYLQQARGYSALGTGLAYLPLMSTFIVSNVASGMVASRTGPRLPMIVGALGDARRIRDAVPAGARRLPTSRCCFPSSSFPPEWALPFRP